VTTSSLADGQIGIAYSETVAATGGVTPYSWSIVTGSLPTGLSLNSGTGEISGTPTTGGTSNFTVRATDSNAPADTDDQALSIYIPDDLVVTTSSLADGQIGIAYSETVAATGGVTPYSLSLNGSTGEISGTPTTQEVANFTVEVTDSNTPADTDQQALSITINPAGGPQTYYVATDGNDGWPGTQAQPWATIQYAVDTILPGDTIIVEDGTYVGARIRSSGTAGNVKTLQAENPGMVLINSAGSQCVACNFELIADTPADGVAYWLVEGLEVTASASFGIEMEFGDNVTIRDCVSHENALAGFYIGQSDYCLIEDCTSYSATSGSGIVIGDSGDNNVLRGNVSYGNSNGIILVNGAGDDQICSGYVVEKNTIYGNASNGLHFDGMESSEVKNNLVYEVSSKGIFFVGFEGLVTPRNNKVANNTIMSNQAGTGSYVVLILNTLPGTIPDGTGNQFYNNVLYHYGTAADDCSICIDTAAETGFESNYNVVMDAFGLDDGATLLTLAEWQGRGHDLNSIQAVDTALFVDPATYDYHLKSDSPAKDAGTTRAEVTDDIEGTARPQGSAYDIGCYEYVEGIPDLVITTSSLADGTVGVAYSETLAATGGVTPYSWAVISGSLPAGLSLNSTTGEISGTPTSSGTSNFTVEVTDSQTPTPDTDQQALSITIYDDLVITTSSLPDGQVGVAYSETLAASGGLPPYTWAVIAGSLPAGLSLNSSTGEISGTPTAYGTSNFTVEVTDSQGTPDSDTQALSIEVLPEDLVITTSSLPNGTEGVAYSETLAATGGITPYTWAVISGSLPAGLSLNSGTGEISGTPTSSGTSNFTVEVTDSQTPTPDSDTQALSIEVLPEDLVITTSSLPNGTEGVAYSETLAATGGITPYTWAVISGSLPAGLSLNSSTGEISGTPTTAETANFTVEVTDSQTPTPDTDQQALSITIDPAAEPLVITTTSLPDGTKKQPYSETLVATGGVTPYTWSIVAGRLPNGLSLDSATGVISGICRKTGTYNFTVRVEDSQQPAGYDEKALFITVN
ncbi:MAG: putative Ig domain-containing protein, partial [Planctomycetota bacterium]|jgi:hypothetical protein